MNTNPLVGTWKLESWEIRAEDGEISYPFGQDAFGIVNYTAAGDMSVTIMRAHRPNFAGNDLLGGTEAEKAAAAESYLSYCGTYDYDGVGERVTHHVEASLFPNWVGMDQVRRVEFAGDTLTLSTVKAILVGGKMQVARLVWRQG